VEIAEGWGAKVLKVAGTQASARNKGVREAKGEYILFLDSDQIVEENLVEECLKLCLNEGFQAIKIPEIFFGRSFWASCSALWRNCAAVVEEAIPRIYRRETILKAGLLKEDLRLWEDLELYSRIRALGIKETWSKAKISHLEASSLLSLLIKALNYGRSIPVFTKKTVGRPHKYKLKAAISTGVKLMSQPYPPLTVLGCLLLTCLKGIFIIFGIMYESILSLKLHR